MTKVKERVQFVGILMLLLVTLAPACSSPDVAGDVHRATPEQRYTIADAEGIGFIKGAQQLYHTLGASDGWDGTLAGDTVELYSFSDTIPEDFFRAWTEHGAEWAGYCQVGNLVMLYRLPSTCDALRQVQTEADDSPSPFRYHRMARR